MKKEPRTPQQITAYIKAARDSVWVINDIITRLNNGEQPDANNKSDLQRNVEHLKIVVAKADVQTSSESIQDLQDAIIAGEAKLAENIWPSEG